MNLVDKVKGKLGLKGEKKYRMPSEYLMVRWKEEKKQYEIYGESGKEIIWVKGGRSFRSYPYSRHLLKGLKENLRLPVWDRTRGRQEPDIDLPDIIDPGKIEVRGF